LTGELVSVDNCGGPVFVTQNPPVTAIMTLGTNRITLVAFDTHTNFSFCQTEIILTANGPIGIEDHLVTRANQALLFSAADLLTNDIHPDNRLLSSAIGIPSGSTNGGLVAFDGTNILYTPPTNYVGFDSFFYTNQDCAGLKGVGRVLLTVNPFAHPFSLLSISQGGNDPDRVTTIIMQGLPGFAYRLQRTTNLSDLNTVWIDLSVRIVPAGGANTVAFYDTNPPSPAFYRAKQP
jgi:hypothetical protein